MYQQLTVKKNRKKIKSKSLSRLHPCPNGMHCNNLQCRFPHYPPFNANSQYQNPTMNYSSNLCFPNPNAMVLEPLQTVTKHNFLPPLLPASTPVTLSLCEFNNIFQNVDSNNFLKDQRRIPRKHKNNYKITEKVAFTKPKDIVNKSELLPANTPVPLMSLCKVNNIFPNVDSNNCVNNQRQMPRKHKNNYKITEKEAFTKHKEIVNNLEAWKHNLVQNLEHDGSPEDVKDLATIDILAEEIQQLNSHVKVYEAMKARCKLTFCKNESEQIRQIQREIYRFESGLPIYSKRIDIEKSFEGIARVVIIQCQAGSGKSTQIPQYIADHPKFIGKKIISIQPSKSLAFSLATRVAFEYNGGVSHSGESREVWYNVDGQKELKKHCRIEFVTEEIMLERIVNSTHDTFKDIGCVIIDEAQEGSIFCDIIFGYFKKQNRLWKDLIIIVTSAYIDQQYFPKFFNESHVCFKINEKIFPVDIEYNPVRTRSDICNAVIQCALKIHLTERKGRGDVLCFLPSVEEVLLAKSNFETELAKCKHSNAELLEAVVVVLFEEMEPDQQSKAFEKLKPTQRKIVFSTGVAENSITIDGVIFVVDCGFEKKFIFDCTTNVSIQKMETISHSSAVQRAKICCKTEPGVCYRLYSEDEFEKMKMHALPEINHKCFSLAVLNLRKMKMDPYNFDWTCKSSIEVLAAADEELKYIGALDVHNNLTEFGKLVLSVQLDPKLVKMIKYGCINGMGVAAINIASAMSISNIIFFKNRMNEETNKNSKKRQTELSLSEGDIVTSYKVFETWMKLKHENSRFQNRNISKWYKENFVNEMAMDYLSLSKRTMLIDQFKFTNIWINVRTQNKEPTNIEICRIACSGYFLNASYLVPNQNENCSSAQYLAVNSEIVGELSNNCAVLNSAKNRHLPQWILYDNIFQTSANSFQTTSFIEPYWIQEISKQFFDLFVKPKLCPAIVKYISQDCLQLIFGNNSGNVKHLEKQLNCKITGDFDTGRLEFHCTPTNKPSLEKIIEDEITAAVSEVENYVVEEDYMNGTRVVIGKGFNVKDVLFPHDYATLLIKNIPMDYSLANLKTLLTQGNTTVGALEITKQGKFYNANAKFCNKTDAKSVHDRLLNKTIENKKIDIFPQYGPKRQISQGLSTRLKLSWSMEESSGKANIEFLSAEDGNHCIENIENIFPGATISRVHGILENSDQTNAILSNITLPPVLRLPLPGWCHECRFRFNAYEINLSEDRNKFTYMITVTNLPSSMDEHEIKEMVKQYCQPKFVSVFRGTGRMVRPKKKFQLPLLEKLLKLEPLRKFMNDDTTTSDFYEHGSRRAGICIHFNSNNNSDAQEAFNKADLTPLGMECGQPHRLEITFTHSLAINEQLLRFMEIEFTAFKLQANIKRILTEVFPPKGSSKFSTMRFRTNKHSNILWLQEKLESLTACTEFKDDKIDLLFTWAGREQMTNVAETGFIQVNYNNHRVWIYGGPAVKEEVVFAIKHIICYLNSLEVLDKEVMLNARRLQRNEKNQVIKICKNSGIAYHHILGNKLFLSGSLHLITRIIKQLSDNGFLQICKTSIRDNEESRECELCFCVPDSDKQVFVTTVCQHLFCTECITPLFTMKPAPPLPVACPAEKCGKIVTLADILKCVPISKLKTLFEVSVFNYQSKHAKEIRICPKPGCSQILSWQSRTTGIEGGDFLFCDECVTTYCITCSEKLGQPTKSHDTSSCEDVQDGTSHEVRKYVKEIQEKLLNLNCPRCKLAFYEFEGCAALICGSESCGCGFCGLCLKDCGSDAHGHVPTCPKNTTNGVYVEVDMVNAIHKSIRKTKVETYIQTILDHKIRHKVCESIHKDLSHLGIEESFIRSLFVRQAGVAEVKQFPSDEILWHVREIQNNILNLCCPRCKQAFYDFDGGVTITCGQCSCMFCGLCLEDCEFEENAYNHIQICPKNVRGDFYLAKHDINEIHRSIRKENIKRYIENIFNHQIRNEVTKAVRIDMVDLGIERNFVESLLVDEI